MNLSKKVLTSVLLLCGLAHGQQIRNANELLQAMHDRYANSWYRTMTFTQKSTTYNADGSTKVETWYEAGSLPGKLRVDIGPIKDGNGFLLADGHFTIFREGKVTVSRPLVNLLLLLGFDVYCQPSETTVKTLANEGIDLSKFHQENWQGMPVYVVGALEGDLSAKQFWVEKDRLLFVRVFQPARDDPKKFQDIHFTDYRKLEKAWIAARVEVHVADQLVFSEDYSDIHADVKLDPAIFDAKQFATAHWEKP